ncbi:MAG TPA: hypothetical protein VMW42_06555 [Desulfatiglandales bacterium]|nr:hypothetical protein [Desulfatiglandales bacterium]
MKTFNIHYRFTFPDGRQEVYDVKLDARSLDLIDNVPEILPYWANLDFHRCPICPLNIQTHPHCPLSISLAGLVASFKNILSYDKIHVDVVTPERIVSMDTSTQRGISSLMGLIIATSGCPHTSFFKPMARFHLPLGTEKETIYRASSMYLLAQYYLRKQGKTADLELNDLKEIYDNIHTVNLAIAERLRAASDEDSSVNALILLDIFAQALPYAIEDSLEEIRYFFGPFLKKNEQNNTLD